ncbi:hypothetical protein [Nonomuraea sp. NPDC002799]
MPNPKTTESECAICGVKFKKPVGSKVDHKNQNTGERCAGRLIPTQPAL